MKGLHLLAFSIFFFAGSIRAGITSKADSLIALLPAAKDSVRADLLLKISEYYLHSDIKKAEEYNLKAKALAAQLNNNFQLGRVYLNYGNLYNGTGDYQKALENLFQAYTYFEHNHNPRYLSHTANSIGNLFLARKSFDKALDYYDQAEVNALKTKDARLAAIPLLGKANVYSELRDYDRALDNYKTCIPTFEQCKDDFALAACYANIGTIYSDQSKYSDALVFLERAMGVMKKTGDKYGLLSIKEITGRVFEGQKKYAEAVNQFRDGMAICQELHAKDNLSHACRDLAEAYLKLNRLDSAYVFMQRYSMLKDSLFTEENAKQEAEMKIKFDTEKKQEAIGMLLKEKEVNEKKQEVQKLEINRNRVFFYALLAGFILIFIIAVGFYRGYRQKRFANVKISRQKELIEAKNKEILDSFHYARRIQSALMASEELLEKGLSEYLIFYKPKDIVSGDFYWAARMRPPGSRDSKFIICTADCTGHGVPGAFMSLLGINFLREIISEKELLEPNYILDMLRESIIRTLNPRGKAIEESRDGMDAVICSFDFKNLTLEFAAANNPLWIVRAANPKVIEIFTADKFPVGMHSGEKQPFSLQSTKLHKGDVIYTLTDGYADQFGGPAKKKFKPKQLKELILSIHHLPMAEQEKILESTFQKWRGDEEQVDDILIIGIRV
jgi:serine phosphatase RsbU (regulator of sigma subunit)/lipopolysaccharide biosynthesis regulator YciM